MTEYSENYQSKEQDPSDSDGDLSRDEELLMAMLNKKNKKLETFGDTEDEFVKALRGLQQLVGLEDSASVIYPGSSTHVGVARVFGKGNVVHVDPDSGAMDVLTEQGYLAVESTIEAYSPDKPVDAIVALNSYGVPTAETITRLVKPGGFVIANNWTHWAAELAKLGDTLELVGAIMPDYQTPDAKFAGADALPHDVTDLVKHYFVLESGGEMKAGTPENHTFADESPTYPDALFVFKRI